MDQARTDNSSTAELLLDVIVFGGEMATSKRSEEESEACRTRYQRPQMSRMVLALPDFLIRSDRSSQLFIFLNVSIVMTVL